MESEELSFLQIIKNFYQKKDVLIKIIILVTIIALVYAFINDMLIKETTSTVLIDKADSSIEDTIVGLSTSKVKVLFEKSKKTITFASNGIDSKNCEIQVQHKMSEVKEKLMDTYSIEVYKIVQEVKTESISVEKILKDIVIFEAFGFIIYCGYVLIIMFFTPTTDEDTIQNVTKLKILGKLYKPVENKKENKLISKIIPPDENISVEKQLKRIKTNLELNKDIKDPKVIHFTSADKKEENSQVIRILAKEYSEEKKTIMILAYNIDNYENIGVESINTMKLSDNNSTIEETKELISEISSKYDKIFIDGSYLSENYLSIIFSNLADTNIIIAKTGKTKIEDIARIKRCIEDVDGKISGIILNKI